MQKVYSKMSFSIRPMRVDPVELCQVAILHRQCLDYTLTSHRGLSTVAALYKIVHDSNCKIVVAIVDGLIAGVIAIRELGTKVPNFRLLTRNPWTWLRAGRILGLRRLMSEIKESMLIQRMYAKYDDHDHILSLFVSPQFRREGIGNALLDLATSSARSRNAAICVDTRANNSNAIRLYQSHEFQIIDFSSETVILRYLAS